MEPNELSSELPRLQKVLAAAGVASRRACEALIAEGRVSVNGKTVREMGLKVDADGDDIRVDGEAIYAEGKPKPVYVMLNKPAGYHSTAGDPHAGKTVMELVSQVGTRVYPVGRLDVDSTGLLILTNDGEFANRLTHPRYHVPKHYRVRARGFVAREAAIQLTEGVELPDGKTAPAEVQFVEFDPATQCTILDITLFEGRNRQVRRMLEAVGHPVRALTRVGFGNLRLRDLNPGTWRKLRPDEISDLLDLARPQPTPKKDVRRPKPTGPYRPRNVGNIPPPAPDAAPAPREGDALREHAAKRAARTRNARNVTSREQSSNPALYAPRNSGAARSVHYRSLRKWKGSQ